MLVAASDTAFSADFEDSWMRFSFFTPQLSHFRLICCGKHLACRSQ
jgi:hypothetical protein